MNVRTLGGVGRAPRIQAPGVVYHVGAKGNRGCPIYDDAFDRHIFLMLLEKHTRACGWAVLTYVLMTNHYHLLLRLREPSLSDGMCGLNGEFSRFTSARYGLEPGHLFRNRFWSEPMEDERHLLATARYIVLNPVRAGICRTPGEWSWSSYQALAGRAFPPAFLAADELLRLVGRTPAKARDAYRALIQAGVDELQARDGARHRDKTRTRARPS